eukprot:sb/3475117/
MAHGNRNKKRNTTVRGVPLVLCWHTESLREGHNKSGFTIHHSWYTTPMVTGVVGDRGYHDYRDGMRVTVGVFCKLTTQTTQFILHFFQLFTPQSRARNCFARLSHSAHATKILNFIKFQFLGEQLKKNGL